MVFIHGGALTSGSGQGPYKGIVNQNTVLVTINYRLGFLGYFAHPELGDATNFGLLDQVKALEWVQKNIAAFGGDPDRVTIFGESAGGTSVLALMVSPLSKGLFHGAIAESPAVFESLDIDVSEAGKIGVAVGEALNIPAGAGQLKQMRSVPAPNFTLASMEKSKEGLGPMTSAFLYVDDFSLTADILQGFEKGMNHKVPLIIGSTADEMDMMKEFVDIIGEIHPQTSESYKEVIEKTFGTDAEAVLSVLPGETDQQALDAAYQLDTDVVFGTPAYLIAKSMASQRGNDEDVFLYYFTQRLKGKVGEKLGAFHASELPYVFNDTEWFIPIANQELANTMNIYWTQFARTGNPNPNTRQDYLPEWKALLEEEQWQILGPEVSSEPIPKDREKIYKLARALYPNDADVFLKSWWSVHDTMQDSHSNKPF
jgi:para-nitrobenzyl esterase